MSDPLHGEILCTATNQPVEVVPLHGSRYYVILRNPTHPDRGISFSEKDGYSWDSAHRIAGGLRTLWNIHENTTFVDETTYYQLASSAELRRQVLHTIGHGDTASSSPSSSSGATPSDDKNECPICFEAVTIQASVRCRSEPCHYFHNACLGRWISQFHHSEPSCPICRQGIEIDAQLLSLYMNDPLSNIEISPDDRRRLQYLLDGRLSTWDTMRAVVKDARMIVDVPVQMFRGATSGFDTLSDAENERLDEGLRIMRSFIRMAYRVFPDDSDEYVVSLWRPHSYLIRLLKRTRKRLLDWTFTRVQITEQEVERAREYDEENARIEEFNHADQIYAT